MEPATFPQVHRVSHPLIDHHLSILRDCNTPPSLFRQQVQRLAMLLAIEATRQLPTKEIEITTPLVKTKARQISARVSLVPILRAGLGLVDPLLQLIPDAEVWHLGMYRDEETAQPVEYYSKLPEHGATEVAYVLDPMLATGGSLRAAVSALKKWGVKDIRTFSLIASEAGIAQLLAEHPDLQVYVCAIDPELNSQKFIVPGLGDAGDRVFNTLR